MSDSRRKPAIFYALVIGGGHLLVGIDQLTTDSIADLCETILCEIISHKMVSHTFISPVRVSRNTLIWYECILIVCLISLILMSGSSPCFVSHEILLLERIIHCCFNKLSRVRYLLFVCEHGGGTGKSVFRYDLFTAFHVLQNTLLSHMHFNRLNTDTNSAESRKRKPLQEYRGLLTLNLKTTMRKMYLNP